MAITLARATFGLVVFQLSMLSAFAISLDADNASFAVKTELQCARSCQGNTSCNSFFYNSVTKQCRLQRYVFVSAANSTVSDTGSRYYRLMSGSCPLEEGYIIDRLTSTCYRPVKSPALMWEDAESVCGAAGGSLAVLEPIERLDFLYNFFIRNREFYSYKRAYMIGMSRPTGMWDSPLPGGIPDHVWVNGQPVDFMATAPYWKPGAPDSGNSGNIGIMRHGKGFLLDDAPNTQNRRYVCQKVYRE
nr:hypothetical protein BaRGS_001875 [Batillaria attramentaria]